MSDPFKQKAIILEAAALAFFPDPHVGQPVRNKLIRLADTPSSSQFVSDAGRLLISTRRPSSPFGAVDLSSEKHLLLFHDFTTETISAFDYWLSGMNNDVLQEFPAQELFCVKCDAMEMVNWPQFWTASGGRLVAGRMIALKWDPLWQEISAFGLCWPPYQIGSGYAVQDIDRDEAERLKFKIPKRISLNISIDLDKRDLQRRIAASVGKYYAHAVSGWFLKPVNSPSLGLAMPKTRSSPLLAFFKGFWHGLTQK